ncbi:hypothetical protein [Hymenobacter cavernae]|uniref:Secreted protein n=1 Tax=Hymenobacter cavernae TaxID=2044852 RepID=A0ABQ1UDY4_9BACT|nr:hypothetical protein [Hymenobacter cavernae]GGF16844.1 hypothetical protein GCM10011383_30380 [Hymenobacter cavernae]
MHTHRSRLATLLLLCFLRVLLPDAWVLALHNHQHTCEEPVHASTPTKAKLLLTAKHQHCQTDNFSHVPFQLASPLEFRLVAVYPVVRTYCSGVLWLSSSVATRYLRGPPHQA